MAAPQRDRPPYAVRVRGTLPSIGASLIVRDEEHCLARCLSSIRALVDEIVIVDTGSIDRSIEIAENFGARVIHRTWTGDFAGARNIGLDAMRCDLVLYLDADEFLADTDPAALLGGHTSDAYVAYRLLLRSRPGFTAYREYRLWENRPEIRFGGVIHESVVPSILAVAEREDRRVGLLDLLLEHDGYEGDQSHKHRRNLPLLLEQVLNDPTRTYLWDHIGRIRTELGDLAGAREAFRTGVDLVRRHGVFDPADAMVFADLIFANAVQDTPDASLVAEGTALFPDNPFVRWCAALDALHRAAYPEVCEHLERVLALDEGQMADMALGLNQRIRAEWAFNVRAMARFEMGDHAAAAEDFARAEAAAPDVLAYRTKRIVAQGRAQRG